MSELPDVESLYRLDNKVCVVTGASSGFGDRFARVLSAAGAKVVVAARRQDRLERLVAELPDALAIQCDVSDDDQCRHLIAESISHYGQIDVLVNNAGIVRYQLLMRMKPEDWDTVIATNLTAVYGCCQSVLRPMMKQRSGRIINISSVVGQSGNPGQTNYSASKAGLIGFSKSLAREVASRGITVNVVAPGMIDTDMTAGLDERAREALSAQIPMARLGVPDEVASVVCFLASYEASYITGQVVAVNGGLYM